MRKQDLDSGIRDRMWKSFYVVGGVAALMVMAVALVEILITFLPGGGRTGPDTMTVVDWFTFLQNHWFLGLRNLGLLNIVMTTLGLPIFLALYGAHRRSQPYAALALIVSLLGVAVFYATNRAFAMLDLSHQYAVATTDSQRVVIAAAGQAMLAVGQSHTPGTFLGFFFSEMAGIIMALVMLQSEVFSKITAFAGLLGSGLLLIFEICSSFVPAAFEVALIFAMGGGLLTMLWYVLIARGLFQLGRGLSPEEERRALRWDHPANANSGMVISKKGHRCVALEKCDAPGANAEYSNGL
jgi:hypothetical protein